MSFDNIFAALFQVVIVASGEPSIVRRRGRRAIADLLFPVANTWTSVMYNMMDADFFVSCLFFIVGLIILNYVSFFSRR